MYSVNELSASVSAPSALSFAHHIYITDGLLFAKDMIKCLEKISTSSIVFSFISYGNNEMCTSSNISSGFGYVADHYLMKFLATATHGFYAIIDDNLDYTYINSNNLLYYPNLCLKNDTSNVVSTRVS